MQSEFAPASVPAQIAILLALTAELFDTVPVDRMKDAESSVREAAAQIPAEVCARFESARSLSDDDRQAIIEIARRALVDFQSTAEPQPTVGPGAEATAETSQ
jgi:F-type H+-transporting ATPase subunit alpha